MGRRHLEARLSIPVRDRSEALDALASVLDDDVPMGAFRGQADLGSAPPRIAFLCPGQGAQYLGMARGLYDTEPRFREAFDACSALFEAHLGRRLIDVVFEDENSPQAHLLHDTKFAQPALFSVSWALAEVWRSWGVKPHAVLGHSLGEFAAACIAGVYSLEDGVRLVAERGRLMSSLPNPGGMASFAASEERLLEIMVKHGDKLSIAAVNGPESAVVSGEKEALADLVAQMDREGVRTKLLDVSFAGHSALVDPALDEFEQVASSISHQSPRIKLISNLTARPVDRPESGWAKYWRRHARHTVRFSDGVRTLAELGCTVFIELGPHTTVTAMGRQVLGDENASWLPSLRRDADDCQQISESIGHGFVRGMGFDWKRYAGGRPMRLISAPTYPFQRERFWPEQATAVSRSRRSRWDTVVQKGRWQAQQTPLDVNLPEYLQTMSTLNGIASAYIRKTLHAGGAFAESGKAYSLADVAASLRVVPGYHKVLVRWLRRLVREGDLQEPESMVFVAPRSLGEGNVDEAFTTSADAFGTDKVLPEYLRKCGEQLPEILRGERNPVDILFEGGRTETSSNLYETGPLVRYFNNICRALVEGLVASQPDRRALRILEIGAGTGGTTSALLPALPNDTYYAFTDLSNFFLDRAQQKFSEYPFIRYGILNAEDDPSEQGYQAASFDLVVAANVIHATANIDQSLQHARSLLAPGGLLMLFETTSHPDWFDISIGLIEGWNLHEDPRRQDHPLLDRDSWADTLTANGFDAVEILPDLPTLESSLFSAVVVARAPGSPESAQRVELEDPYLSPAEVRAEEESSNVDAFREELSCALPGDRRDRLVLHVRERIARVLRLAGPSAVDPGARLLDLGLDSLMAIDLRNVLAGDLGLEHDTIPATLIFDCPTADAVAAFLDQLLEPDDRPAPEVPSAESTVVTVVSDEIDSLDEEELEDLLARKLEAMGTTRRLEPRENE